MKLILNIETPVENWNVILENPNRPKDTIVLSDSMDDSIWFSTNIIQFFAREGNCEVIPVYGKLVNGLENFIYQVNCCLPVGYRIKNSLHALYDLFLNFETEPNKRVFVWNDAEYLLKQDKNCFIEILEVLLQAAISNRNGWSTIKEDGTVYQVNQKVILVFNNVTSEDLRFMDSIRLEMYTSLETSTPEIISPDFNVVTLE